MSRQGGDRAAGFAAENLKGSRTKPSQSGGIHAEAGDHRTETAPRSVSKRKSHEQYRQQG
jgi:hypothetical protein